MALSVVTLPVSRDVSATTDHFTERGEEGERTKFVQFVIILDIQLMPQRGVMAVKWDQMVGRCAAAAAVLQCVHYIQLYTPGFNPFNTLRRVRRSSLS